MSVLIKYMKMPTSCEDCPLEYYDENYYGDESNHRCPLIYKGYTSNNRYEKRRDDCPLVPIQPHGRLIDADKIGLTNFEIILCQKGNPFKNALEMLLEKIENAPTVIQASMEE